jgi:signal transduction histidine kinase
LVETPIDLHSCIESLQANVFIADKNFNLVYMNSQARKTLEAIEPEIKEVFQLNIGDIQGGSIHRFHRDPQKVEAILRNPSALPHLADFEFGDVILRTAINAVWDESGQLEAFVVNWENVSESKKLEQALNIKLKELNDANQELIKRNRQIELDELELKQSHAEQHKLHAYMNVKLAELKQSNQDLESFATIASHDLMAPVRKIINFAGSLLENDTHFSENEKFILDNIIHSGKRMRLLMDDILEYSRLAGHSSTFERVNLNDVLSEVLANLSFEIMETKGEVLSEALPIIEANKTQMVQLFQNLISNSLKYRRDNVSPVIKVLLILEDGEFTNSEGFVNIALKDNGMGIDDEYSSLVFQPFERLNPQIEGTGMGLAICKKVVVSHGGDITVKNRPDEDGSVFNITLPERHSK